MLIKPPPYILFYCAILLTAASQQYKIVEERVDRPIPYTIQYYLTDMQDKQVSPWADIAIDFDVDTLTCVIEIVKESCAKMQMVKQAPGHPIVQDIRTSKYNNKIELRHYAIPLPLVNYGYIPMTWEQTITKDASGYYGDDDPIDVVDLSTKGRNLLDIARVKVLGAFCLIDEGELDWKVFVMDVDQAKILNVNSYEDLPAGRVQEIIDWFKVYKTYEGKPVDEIGFGEKIFSKEETLEIIFDTHVEFMKVKNGMGVQYAARKTEFNL